MVSFWPAARAGGLEMARQIDGGYDKLEDSIQAVIESLGYEGRARPPGFCGSRS
jgi:hypothetical protein